MHLESAHVQWHLLDSCRPHSVYMYCYIEGLRSSAPSECTTRPHRVYMLSDPCVAYAFDADLTYTAHRHNHTDTLMPRRRLAPVLAAVIQTMALPLMHSHARGTLTQPVPPRSNSVAASAALIPDSGPWWNVCDNQLMVSDMHACGIEPAAAWPGAPGAQQPLAGGLPLQVLRYFPRTYTDGGSVNRKAVLADRLRHGLHAMMFAAYDMDQSGRQPDCPAHCRNLMYRLNIHNQRHVFNVCADIPGFQHACRHALHGANAVVLAEGVVVAMHNVVIAALPEGLLPEHVAAVTAVPVLLDPFSAQVPVSDMPNPCALHWRLCMCAWCGTLCLAACERRYDDYPDMRSM
eukprot:jgi/Ulvmu1/7004/UM033_0062.1